MVRLRIAGPALTFGVALALVLPSQPAAALERYDDVVRGGVVVTGNTLGLSKASNANGPGLLGSIGTFIRAGSADADLDPENSGNPWFAGTTNAWQDNRSAADLVLPAGATVTYAELVWGGSYEYGSEDVSANLDDSVTMAHGASTAVDVAPDPETATTLDETAMSGFDVRYYARSADVTAYVAAHGAGSYTVGHVPATQTTNIQTTSAAGWSLAVAYEAPGAPLRRVAVDVSSGFVDEDSVWDEVFEGSCLPAAGGTGSLLTAALEGDNELTGDTLLVGPSLPELVGVSGPNNPADNVFASQLNGSSGALDTTGTFGERNHEAATGTNSSGARQGMDVTTLPIPSAALGEDLEDLWVRYSTIGDNYMPMLTGLVLDTDAPLLSTPAARFTPSTIRSGGTTTLTLPISNTGSLGVLGATIRLPLPDGVSVTAVSVDSNPRPVADLAAGLPVGTIPVGSSRTVDVTLVVTGSGTRQLAPLLDFDYSPCSVARSANTQTATPVLIIDSVVPQTSLTGKPKKKSKKAKATFRFFSSEPGRFECSLDRKAFATCASGKTYRVKVGKHTFKVRAVDAVGNVDRSPASYKFIRKPRPKA